MPSYEFKCEKCHALFLEVQTFAEHDKHPKLECPKCGSKRVRQLISSAHVQTSKKS